MYRFTTETLILFITILIVSFTGCQNRNTSPDENAPESLVFNIDPTLLNPSVTDSNLGITYSPPSGWDAVSQEAYRKIKSSIENNFKDSSYINIKPVNFYSEDSSKGILTVSSLQFLSDNGFHNNIDTYKKILTEKFLQKNIKNAEYLKDGIHITQFLIQLPGKIIFKILFRNSSNQFIQLDYITERNFYPSAIKSIESSIGSIQLTHNKQTKGEVL